MRAVSSASPESAGNWSSELSQPDADAARAGIAAFRSWLKSLGLPLTFAELGAKEEDIPLLVKTLNLCGNTLGGFQPLTEDDVAAIYRLCLAPNA